MESDFSRFKKLKDLCEVEISQELTPTEKKDSYLHQVGSSTVLNEYYVMESSEKVRKSCRMRIRNGAFIGDVSYGYFLSDKYTPVIDEEKAEIIREIFMLYLDGSTTRDIAKMLNKRGVPTAHGKKWTFSGIHAVLKNEQYIGKRVSLTRTMDVKRKCYVPNDESDWYVDETAFPPIIEHEVFTKVQERIRSYKKRDMTEHHIMARKLYCAGCGRTM